MGHFLHEKTAIAILSLFFTKPNYKLHQLVMLCTCKFRVLDLAITITLNSSPIV